MPWPQSQNRNPLTEQDYAIYAAALADLPGEVIERACEKYIKTGKFFPLPGDLLGMITVPEKAAESLIAEESWQAATTWMSRYYLGPDIGIDRRAPELEEKQWRGLMAAGDFEYLSRCTLEQLQWAKKQFIANYSSQVTVEREIGLIGSGEAKKILANLRSEAPAKQLQPPAQFRQPQPGPLKPDSAALRAFDDLREKLNAPEPRTAARPAQGLDERLAELQRQAEEVKTKYGSQEAAP